MSKMIGPALFAKVEPCLLAVLSNLEERHLANPTPCEGFTVSDVANHFAGFFRISLLAARKLPIDVPFPAEDEPLAILPKLLSETVAAWQENGATDGTTVFPSGTYAASRAAELTVHESVIHTWDLAKATSQQFTVDDPVAELVIRISDGIDEARRGPGKPFAQMYPVPPDEPLFARAIASSGRNPSWSPGDE